MSRRDLWWLGIAAVARFAAEAGPRRERVAALLLAVLVTLLAGSSCGGEGDGGRRIEGSFSSIDAGDGHTCGVTVEGIIRCWGSDYRGQATPPGGEFASVSAGMCTAAA